MTFSIDRTRSFLKIEESNLLSLHRSIHPIAPSADYCQGHLCDAFICVVNEYNLHRVYLSLHDQQLKSNLVFISDPFRPDNKKTEALLLKANEFLDTIGFKMEQVNISFSQGMREVIIKDIKVLREPPLDLQLDAAKMALESLVAEKNEVTLKASREHMELKAELEVLKKRLVAAAAVQQASVVKLPAITENRGSSALQGEPDALHKELRILREEGEGLRSRLVDAENELQKVQEELGSVKALLKSTRESLKNAKDEARQAKKEQKLHKHESDLLNETLKSERMDLDKAKNEFEVIRREFQEARKVNESAEINRLMAEVAGKDSEYAGETEGLRAALTEANVSLSAEKAKNESALQEMDALEHASAELKLLKKKVDTLTAEKKQLENITAEIKIKAHGEIERHQQVNQSQRKAAIKKLNALKEEIRQLAEARAVIASPTGMPLVQSGNNVSPFPADDRKETSVVSQQASFSDPFRSSGMPLVQSGNNVSPFPADDRKEISVVSQQASFSDPFRSSEATEYIDFLPDKSLKGIPYSLSTDVVEIYRSYNTIHAAPNGKQAQKCDGFVCLVTEGGQSLVYVAWLMNSTGEVLICLPERVAGGDDSCRQTLREGIGYFERIGFFIDSFHLEKDPHKRQVQLDDLAVFCRTVTDCAA